MKQKMSSFSFRRRSKQYLWCAFCLLCNVAIQAQNVVYETPYTDTDITNYESNLDVSLPTASIAASADVSASGGANYSIPITVPIGTNDLSPELTISYNSQGSNGLLGMGWNLGGLSVISRTPQSIYFDGEIKGISATMQDKFTIDGMRLLDGTGTYGSNNATYQTEIMNFATITSYGTLGNGPEWFNVITKEGTKMEYGNSASSRFMNSTNTTVLFWRLSKIIDNTGNTITFFYDNTDADSRISRIEYVANPIANLWTGASAVINFNYKTRTDINTIYLAQTPITSKYLLDNIAITIDAQIFKSYQFSYTNDNICSFLKKVTESGSNGTNLNATRFKYGDQPLGLEPPTTSTILEGQSADITTGDFDGDGYSNILAATYSTDPDGTGTKHYSGFRVYKPDLSLACSIGFPGPSDMAPNFQLNSKDLVNFMTSDYTGDGQDDVLGLQVNTTDRILEQISLWQNNGTAAIFSSTPTSNFALPTIGSDVYNKINSTWKFICSGDYDGDGAMDYILTLFSATDIFYKSFVSFPSKNIFNLELQGMLLYGDAGATTTQWLSASTISPIDFDGDGKQELLFTYETGCKIWSFTTTSSTCTVNLIYESGFPTKWHKTYFADFNGDGKTDFLSRPQDGTQWEIAIGTGNGWTPSNFNFNTTPNLTYSAADRITVADFNSDGKTDILHGRDTPVTGLTTGGVLDVYYSKGNNSFYSEQYTFANNRGVGFALIPADLNGDGRSDIISQHPSIYPLDIYYIKKNGTENILQKAANGVGHITEYSYRKMNYGSTFYTKGAVTASPLNNIQLPINLVYQFKQQNGIGGTNTTQYTYEEAKLHKQGKGFLGFKKITADNLTAGIKTISENEFNTTFYVALPLKNSTYLSATNQLLDRVTLTNTIVNPANKRFWVKTNSTNNKAFEGRTTTITNVYDNYANITQSTTAINGNTNTETSVTATTYGAFGNSAIPALPTSVTTTNTRTGQAAYSQTTTYGYNSIGQLTSKTNFSGLPKSVTTTYTYNALGNVTNQTVSATGLATQSTSYSYDTKGRFQTAATNTLGQTTSATYDTRWGKPLTTTDLDGIVTAYQYDAFGRPTQTTMRQGTIGQYNITYTYGWASGIANAKYWTKLTHPGKPDVKTYYDKLDREVRTETEAFGGQWVTQTQTYDAKGNIATQTQPYKTAETILTTTNTYDAYNRLTTVANTLGTISYTYTYTLGLLNTTLTNAAGQTSNTITDATGKTITATDPGGTLAYTYNSQGNVLTTTQAGATVSSSQYDSYGQQTQLTDPNAGTTTYTYNAYGQLISQTNANAQTHTMQYNALGQITQRQGPEGTITYEYYTTTTSDASINQIKKITGFAGETTEFFYDQFNRPYAKIETIDGIGYLSADTYNTYDQITQHQYPSNAQIRYNYDANGYLNTIKNDNNTQTLFTNLGTNGLGQYTSYLLGNGKTSNNSYYFGKPTQYQTTGIQNLTLNWNYTNGNLNSRYDAIKNRTETFTYDNLNRLLSATVTGQTPINMTYANNGNISTKTDAGTYTYHATRINALSNLTNPSNNIPANQAITYTAYFQPATIAENNYLLTYTYGADYQRTKAVLTQAGNTINTRYYFANCEKNITGTTTRWVHYINSGQGLIAIMVLQGTSTSYYYTYTDHLGSILSVTNNTGTVIAEQNFDPWGRRRNTTTWNYTSPTIPTQAWLYRGYTAHEHLDPFNLINMNGRLYDPIAARMLSPDNYVQNPQSTQNYNRYTYVLNNPLKYTDPDGEWVHVIAGALIGGFINGIMHANKGPEGFFKGFAIGAVAGAVTAATGGLAAGAFATGGLVSVSASAAFTIGVSGGAIAGATGAVLGAPILAAGNYLAFGDKYSWKRYGIDIALGGIIGGIAGGISAAMANRAARAAGDFDNIRDIWTGKIKSTGVGANARYGWKLWNATEPDVEGSSGQAVVAYAKKVPLEAAFDTEVALNNALSQFKGGSFTQAGRAVTKHPEYFGFPSDEALRQVYRTPSDINSFAATQLNDILRNGTMTSGTGSTGWVTYTLPNGTAASWRIDGAFIGFRKY